MNEITSHVSLRSVVELALSELDLSPQDMAARELALIFAEGIDSARESGSHRNVSELGSKLTTILTELLMTPKSRQAIKTLVKGDSNDDDPAARVLAELQNA